MLPNSKEIVPVYDALSILLQELTTGKPASIFLMASCRKRGISIMSSYDSVELASQESFVVLTSMPTITLSFNEQQRLVLIAWLTSWDFHGQRISLPLNQAVRSLKSWIRRKEYINLLVNTSSTM